MLSKMFSTSSVKNQRFLTPSPQGEGFSECTIGGSKTQPTESTALYKSSVLHKRSVIHKSTARKRSFPGGIMLILPFSWDRSCRNGQCCGLRECWSRGRQCHPLSGGSRDPYRCQPAHYACPTGFGSSGRTYRRF